MRVGTLSEILNLRVLFLGTIIAIFVTILLGYRAWLNTSQECVRCHSDKKKMEELNATWAYVTDDMVQKESRHPHIQCRDCHLGDGRAKDKDRAHKDVLKMLIVSEEAKLLERKSGYPYGLSRTGDDRLLEFLPKVYINSKRGAVGETKSPPRFNGEWQFLPVRNILWHDRNPETFDLDPKIIEKTCGKSECHPGALKQFKSSIMGRNYRQRTMRTWLIPYGPHNCGPSFADQPPAKIQKDSTFDYTNTERIMKEMNVPFTIEQARDKQRFCNVCHTGCLDCHYTPKRDGEKVKGSDGTHSFARVPPAESCAGFGRGNTICHSGTMHSRRGETYIGGDYSVPQGMTPDVHYKKGMGCVECHPAGKGGMGHMDRKATCQDCHFKIEEAHNQDVHSKMDCATCHIRELRGYQITVWGPGLVAKRESPFYKYLYYGIQSPPILVKDQKGVWMPVKVWPHSLGNVTVDVTPSEDIQFRWPEGETKDAYYVIGTLSIQHTGNRKQKTENRAQNTDYTADNKHLLWLEIEPAAHPFGHARGCASCHASQRQVSSSKWEFLDDQGAEPFSGEYRIVADERGLRIEGLKATSRIKLLPRYKPVDFAPWLYLKDEWRMPGDFSIKTDPEKYREYHESSEAVRKRLKILDARSRSFDKKIRMKYQELRGLALHNPEEGLRRLEVRVSDKKKKGGTADNTSPGLSTP